MTQADFYALCKECERMVRDAAPIKTGNLRYNAIKVEIVGNSFTIYIDETIAPYMKYTNESWAHGKNPNEGWFDRAAEAVANHIAQVLNGSKTQNDIA